MPSKASPSARVMNLADYAPDPSDASAEALSRAVQHEDSKILSEQATHGPLSTQQGLSTSPYGGPDGTGLMIPSFVNSNANRFTFLLCAHRVAWPGVVIVKLRQLVTLLCDFAVVQGDTGTAHAYVEIQQGNPIFAFPDGNVSYHIVLEPEETVIRRPSTDANGFAFYRSDTPALLYRSATYSAGAFDPATGAPYLYDRGMTAYQPPDDIPSRWIPVEGYANRSDIFSPWTSDTTSAIQVPIPVDGNMRLCMYATVLQTNPATRPQPPGTASNLGSDWSFIVQNPAAAGVSGVRYGRVAGAMLIKQLT